MSAARERRRALLACALAAALPAAAQNTNDPREAKTQGRSGWEIEQERRNFKEGEIKLPAAPKAGSLIEFFPSSATNFRFYIDGSSLEVDPAGIIRYTLVARSPNGYDNVTYEGMRCGSNSVRVYAYGNAGAWSRSDSDWKPIEARSVQRWHNELRNQYFCPLGVPIMTVDEGLRALRARGHPLVPANSDLRR